MLHLSDPVDGHSCQTVELSLSIAVTSNPESVLTLFVKYLYPMIGGVCHHDSVVRSHSNTSRPSEKSGLAPPSAELQY